MHIPRLDRVLIIQALSFLLLGAGVPALAESGPAPPPNVRVDARVELMSVLFRLAGNPEYNRPGLPAYAAEVDEHFASFRDHAAVRRIRELRRTRGVSYDAPMGLAVHLADVDTLKGRLPWQPRPARLDGRWRPDELQAFLVNARDFVRESDFLAFYDSHRDLYDRAAERMQQAVTEGLDVGWFEDYFGTPRSEMHVIIAMLNGPNCYGASFEDGDREEAYSIVGAMLPTNDGVPSCPPWLVPLLVHEFCHTYVNPVVYRRAAEIEEPARAVFARVEDRMRKMAYGNWQTMAHETLVRACVVRYTAQKRGPFAATMQMLEEQQRGFAWVPEVCALLEQYEADRERYPTLDGFFPRIVEFFEEYAASLPPLEGQPTDAAS